MKSKFSFWQVYFVSFFLLAFFILGCYFLVHPEIQVKPKFGGTMSGSVAGLFFIIIITWMFYAAFKDIYSIAIENKTIYLRSLFKRKRIEENDIQSIDLLANRGLGMATNSSFCTVIKLENDEQLILGDVFYKNVEDMKRFIEKEFRLSIISQTTDSKKPVTFLNLYNGFEKFAGNQFTSLNGIIFYGMSIFFVCMFWNAQRISQYTAVLICFGLISTFYLAFGKQMHYFLVSNNEITIKNRFWFWHTKKYNFEDILQANMETPYKQSTALRITLNNYESKNYSAGSLREFHWENLKARLQEAGIFFRD